MGDKDEDVTVVLRNPKQPSLSQQRHNLQEPPRNIPSRKRKKSERQERKSCVITMENMAYEDSHDELDKQ